MSAYGILQEVTSRRRGRVFGFTGYLAILSEETEPLPTVSGNRGRREAAKSKSVVSLDLEAMHKQV